MMLNVLICGAGNIAQAFDMVEGDAVFTHVKAYTRHGGFHVAAIIDADRDRAKEAAAKWNIPRYGTCLEDVADIPFDCVSICTPDHTHATFLRDVLELQPKLVFCEKPLAASVEEASVLVTAYEKAKISLAVNYSRRWLQEFQDIRSKARSGAFGKVVSARMKYYKGFRHNASHFVDTLAMVCSPNVVDGFIVGSTDDYVPEDLTLSLVARMKSGIGENNEFALMVEGYDSRQMSPLECEIVFEKASVRFEEVNGSFLTVALLRENTTYPGFYEFSERTTTRISSSDAMQRAIAAIYAVLSSDAAQIDTAALLASTGATALETLRLCSVMELFPNRFVQSRV
jgi:predicted dehydrogenase